MPGIWIDVENGSGVRYGSGPITSASEWHVTDCLDRMGTFSFAMPAADPQAALLANKRHVRCFLAADDAVTWPGEVLEIGHGIIDRIERLPSINGPTMLVVTGTNLLVELANTTVGELDLYTDVSDTPDIVTHWKPGGGGYETTWTAGDAINLEPSVSFICVKHEDQFISVAVTLGASKNSVAGVLKGEFLNAAGEWEDIDITDTTSGVDGKPFSVDGTISWEIPSGWTADGGKFKMGLTW